MKIRKTVSLALVLMMAVGLMAGCGGTTPASSSDTPASSAEQTASTADSGDGRPMEGNMYLEGLPIVKEQETFTIFCDDSGLPEEKAWYPILEEQTNVKVELNLMPYEAARERLSIYLNSGDYPDVIGGWLLDDSAIMRDGMQEGIYIPLDDLIEKYSPKMREVLEIGGVRETMTLPDGHIYTVPYAIEEPLVTFLPYINQQWLDDLGLSMPTTTDELLEVLRAFKAGDPAGGGRTIPFSADPNNRNLGAFAGWWGADAHSAGQSKYFALVDGKLTFGPATDAYKEMIKYFANLYAEGLLDPELYTMDLAGWKARGKEGLYGVSMAYGAGDFAEENREKWPDYSRTDYMPLPVLKGSDDAQPLWRRNSYGMTVFRTQVVITDTAKNPATIIRWWDNVFAQDNSAQIQWGPIGVKIEKAGEKLYTKIPDSEISDADKETYEWSKMFTQSMPKFLPPGVILDEGPVYQEKKEADALYEPYLNEIIPQAWVSETDAGRLSILETDIDEYMKRVEAAWVTGQQDVEAGWEAHLAQLETLGLDELTQIRQAAIDATK
jgi:putative aldouronate transport system substrate-binding protein